MAVAANISEAPAERGRAGVGVWTGRIMSGVVVAFLLMDATMKLMNLPIVASTGWVGVNRSRTTIVSPMSAGTVARPGIAAGPAASPHAVVPPVAVRTLQQ